MQLSIILPCYNVEQYIAECLDSLYMQDIPESEYEIICINDCSPDRTRDIIIQYQTKHANLSLIENAVNKHQGISRNIGFDAAKGKYIWFVDPDDYIEHNIIGTLISECEDNNLDVLNFELYKVDLELNIIKNKLANPTEVIPGKNFIHQLGADWQLNGSVGRKVFLKSFLIEIQLYFKVGNYLQDQIYSLRSVYYAKRFRHCDKYCYYYRFNPTSTVNTRMTATKYLSVYTLASDLSQFSEEIKANDPQLSTTVYQAALWYFNFVIKQFFYFKAFEREIAMHYLNNMAPILLHENAINGWKLMLLRHLKEAHTLLYPIAPILIYTRAYKRNLRNKHSS
ncbi:glycosyltransferase family 2 protein [Microbacter margulisiae]|uniref:Glycosyltransferase involved in cell wall biosynthesis n=1 Tax=Microbacter margulisiae TaxID=1350067 RepID=A0A7W5DTE7_9PORP|nr:glycosyltransferase family 2 protein [Microbacter margulisiae]MBB3188415.1 glycosyltransferase involved in cell wall biosynthesis [Microbacter margulisiae]